MTEGGIAFLLIFLVIITLILAAIARGGRRRPRGPRS